MKIAIVDTGTNTCRLAIFEVTRGGGRELVVQRNTITRLGAGLTPGGKLDDSAVRTTIKALESHKREIEAHGCARTVAVATQAVRVATDGRDFIKAAATVGFDFEVLTGEQEAELSFRGVVSQLEEMPARLLVFDSGGGSTEFTYAVSGAIEWMESIPLGAVSGRSAFFRNDPPAAAEITAFGKHCRDIVSNLVSRHKQAAIDKCIGVAGTITTLAMIDLGLPSFSSEAVHGHEIIAERIDALTERLCSMNDEQRRGIPGMQRGRADIIHAGAVIVRAIKDVFGPGGITVSECDIRHGLLDRELDMMNEGMNRR